MTVVSNLVAGVDEVGRGPLAGTVVAAAVILDPDKPIEGLTDSKKLTAKRRAILSEQIKRDALAWCIAEASVEEIDRINILHASMLAMERAVAGLKLQPQHALVDGNRLPNLSCSADAIVKGDLLEPAIGAASIIAKVARDTEMIAMDERYPGYGFAQNKGYPTAQHRQAIEKLGPTPIHRRSFAPVQRALQLD